MSFRSSLLSVLLCLVVVAPVALSNVGAHTFHTSLMELEYNNEDHTVEISIEVFAHDLENILSQRAGRNIRLDKSPDADKLTLAYLREAVNLRNSDGATKQLTWVGMESQADAVLLYVETKMPEGLAGAQVRDQIFFDLLEDQVNLVHVKYDGKKADLVFKRGEDFKSIVYAPVER